MLRRLSNIVRGWPSLFISGLEKQSPESLLEIEKENPLAARRVEV